MKQAWITKAKADPFTVNIWQSFYMAEVFREIAKKVFGVSYWHKKWDDGSAGNYSKGGVNK